MSPIGRIFSVINLVLAAVFLAWAAMNLATSQEFKDLYEAEQAAHETTRQENEQRISELNARLDTVRSEMDSVVVDRDKFKEQAERKTEELTAEEAANSDLRASYGRLSNSYDGLQGQLETQSNLKDQAVAARNDAERAKDSAEETAQEADSSRRETEAENAALKNTISDLEKAVVMRDDMISSLEVQLEQLQVLTGASLSDIIPQKNIEGTVVQALYEVSPGLIAINRGARDGVVRGYTFEISAGTQYKGQVRVENVRDDMCTCVILRTEPGQKIMQGDRADTVL